MKKRLIAITIICAIMMGFSVQAANPTTNFMATNATGGAVTYGDSFEELAASVAEGSVITLLKDMSGSFSVSKNLKLELGGNTITGTVTVGSGVTLQVSDNATADYDVSDGNYGTIQVAGAGNVVGAAATENSDPYLKVANGDKLSFHAVSLNIDGMALKIEKQGLYFDHTFRADSVAKDKVLSYGILVNRTRVPVEADLLATPNPNNKTVVVGNGYAYTSFAGNFGEATSTLVSGIMKEHNGYATNRKNANVSLYGRAYIKTAEGYLLGVCRQRSLRQQIEEGTSDWSSVTAEQRLDLARLYRNDVYNRVMKSWNLPNLKSHIAQVGVATSTDIAKLNSLYADRTAYHGEMHDHSKSGGTADGKVTLADWKTGMDALNMDFAFIVDHKQTLHMDDAEWDATYFVGGSEAATTITDRPAGANNFHYDMVFTDKDAFERVLRAFPEFGYHEYTSGDYAGQYHFGYPNFTAERFCELLTKIKEEGGYFSSAHLSSSIKTMPENILDLYYQDYTSLMIFYDSCGTTKTKENYQIWTKLLAEGKRVWAAAGNDRHGDPQILALSTIYSESRNADDHLSHVRVGDFTAGFAGVRMAVGDTVMGRTGTFKDQRLVFSVGDFFENKHDHDVTVSLVDDLGTVFTYQMKGNESMTFAIDADENAKFYRVEVYDNTDKMLIALGNPIWNSAFYQD